ncbi:hypothetical protein, no similarity [Maudiozyma saulgeensis]|uniref:Uncharacterized protein n=1 Tax=Maudiozyma saulgeensis TaxID=1789683 RepID=A0A1X7R1V2_9SACH|nr:hypothetical protein, no similarity [Kazachstania saulgeensis]
MQNIQGAFCFTSPALYTDQRNMSAYALRDGKIKDVTPDDWTTLFKDVLISYEGAVLVISKEEECSDLNDALKTYEEWCTSSVNENLILEDKKMKWVQYTNSGGDSFESFKFSTLVKGQILVLSGAFPDIIVKLDAIFGLETITNSMQCNLIMIAVLKVLMERTLESLFCIEKDIIEKETETRKVVLMKNSLHEEYMGSRGNYLVELSHTLFNAGTTLRDVTENIKYLCTNDASENVIKGSEIIIKKGENKITQLMIKLREMRQTVEENGTKFFDSVKWIIDAFLMAAVAIGVAFAWFLHDKESRPRKYTLIAVCVVGFMGMIFRICACVLWEQWSFRWRKF